MQIEKEHFEHWLFSLPPDRRFNYVDCENCLIASFIKETTNISFVSVGSCTFRIPGSGPASDHIPDWACQFLHKVIVHDPDYRVRFTAAEAREAWLAFFPDPVAETERPEPVLA